MLVTRWRWLGVVALVACCALPAQAQRTVTLRLNTATMPDTVKTNITRNVQVRGCLVGCTDNQSPLPGGQVIAWDDRTTIIPGNTGGDYWSVNFQIPDNQELQFKFFIQQSENNPPGIGGWEDGSNHTIPSGTGPVTLDLHYFEKGTDQPYNWRPFESGGDSVSVWFRVYMNTQSAVATGYDNPGDPALVVGVRGDNAPGGNQNGQVMDWGSTNIVLRRESTDNSKPGYHLFSGEVTYPSSAVGQVQNYKFVFQDANTPIGWEGTISNRTFTIPSADSTLYWKYFDDSPPVTGTVVTAPVAFIVDSQPLVNSGVFDANRGDSLQVRGAFNGWDCDNPDDCRLERIPGSFEWAIETPITAVAGSQIEYKYYIDFAPTGWQNIGWEEPLDNGGGNRSFTFTGAQQELNQVFNDIRSGNVIPTGTTVNTTFRVDMERATQFSDPFNPATDSVYVQFEDPTWLLTQGYAPGDPRLIDTGSGGNLIRGFVLTDPDGDLVYTGTLAVAGPTYNGIGYRHVFGGLEAGDALVTEGSGGFAAGRRRYRYILPSGGWPANFTLGIDGFRRPSTDPNPEPTPWEINPTDPDGAGSLPNWIFPGAPDPVGIEEVGGELPATATLGQNYPNPFNPTTVIEYAVPQAGPVSLVLFDVTGRAVATLFEGVQQANTYRVTFDASDLASGVYVYQLRAGGTVLSRRMTILK